MLLFVVFIGLMVFDNNNLMVNNYYVNISYENLFIDINLMIIYKGIFVVYVDVVIVDC